MKKLLIALSLLVVTSLALALPAPKEIEAAVQAGQLQHAESMLREVIKEKPTSAKAHYELGQVLARLGRNGEARQELLSAQRIDPALKFAKDPQRFHDLLGKIPQGAAAASAASRPLPMAAAPAAAPPAASFPWGYLLLAGGFIFAVTMFLRRRQPAPAGMMPAGMQQGGMQQAGVPVAGGFGAGPGYGAPGYGAPQQAPGSGIGGAVLGGLAGMAAGYGLSKVLGGNENHASQQAAAAPAVDNGYVPITTPPDYGSFDAGNGDSWDNAGADNGGGGDDW